MDAPQEFDEYSRAAERLDAVDDERIWTLLSVYADGEATPEETAQVEALLRSDVRYNRELAFLRETTQVTRTFEEVEPPAFLRQAILASTTRRQTLAQRLAAVAGQMRRALAPHSLVALSAGACAVAAFLLLAHRGQPVDNFHTVPTHPDATTGPAQIAFGPSTQLRDPKALPHGIGASARVVPHETHRTLSAESHPAAPERRPTPQLVEPTVTLARNELSNGARLADLVRSVAVHNAEAATRRSQRTARVAPRRTAPATAITASGQTQMAADFGPGYSVDPNMDLRNEHMPPHVAMADMNTDADPRAIVNDSGEAVAKPEPAQPAVSRTMRSHLILSELPPPSTLTGADIRRMRFAMTQGYSRATIDGTTRGQATVSLIGGRF